MSKIQPPIAICGWGRSGKDTAADALHNLGPLKFCGSTSWHALPYMAGILKLPAQVAWDTRHERRDLWKSYCDFLRKDDPLFLVRLALKKGNIVSGIRDKVEIQAAIDQKVFSAILWISRPNIPEDKTVTYDHTLATDVLNNDGDVDQFRRAVREWAAVRGLV